MVSSCCDILTIFMKKQVKVKPNSKQQRIVEAPDGSLTVSLKSPPTDGKANAELIKLLADHFSVSKASVTIQTGFTSKVKWVDIDGV